MTTIVAWTGHRPKDLDINRSYFNYLLEKHMDTDDIEFVTGGALGIDTWAAEFALNCFLPLHLILPFPVETMGRFWTSYDQSILYGHTIEATTVRIIDESGAYNFETYQRRNEAMVDKANMVCAYWTGKTYGGTWNCIQYARMAGKPVFNLRTGAFL